MKTPEETKKGLECANNCSENGMTCRGCPYLGENCSALHPDALAYIQQLEATVSEKEKVIAELLEKIEQLQRERDAAVNDIKCVISAPEAFLNDCVVCKYKYRPICESCEWEWRGVCPENTEVQDG